MSSGCVVYSLGSAGNFKFEDDVLTRTTCMVVTFDCTSHAASLHPERHKYVQKCIGSNDRMVKDPVNWVTLERAMQDLGHSFVSLLKIDIEGFEYDVVSHWESPTTRLPHQIAMEIHYRDIYSGSKFFKTDDFTQLLWPRHEVTLAELALFVGHLSSLGYGIVAREDNPLCQYCTELTLLRVAC